MSGVPHGFGFSGEQLNAMRAVAREQRSRERRVEGENEAMRGLLARIAEQARANGGYITSAQIDACLQYARKEHS